MLDDAQVEELRAEVLRVIADIGRLEPTIARPPTRRSVEEWYWLPLAGAALCLSLARLVRFREQDA